MARLVSRLRNNDDGSIMILVAMVLPLVMSLMAGGIMAFGLLNGQRELQAAADHAALAAAAALPPLDPNVVMSALPFPMQICPPGGGSCISTSSTYTLGGTEAANLLQTSQLIPDPRAVACAYAQSDLGSTSAPLVTAFANANLTNTPSGDQPTVCTQFDKINGRQIINNGHTVPDPRIYTSLLPGTVLTCINNITNSLSSTLTADLSGLLGTYGVSLNTVLSPLVDPLNQIAPALLSPQVKVDLTQGYNPPLLSMITGNSGVDLQTSSIARRRLKNAIVIKLQPGQRVGLLATGGVNMQSALEIPQTSLLTDLTTVNTALVNLESSLTTLGVPGLNCTNPLGDLMLDLKDIYNPSTGASSAVDLVSQAVSAVTAAAARTGIPASSIQQSGFLMIGVGNASNNTITVGSSIQSSLQGALGNALGNVVASLANGLMGPVASLQIPILDAALVSFSDAGNGKYDASCVASPSYPTCPVLVDAANAWGAFRASLVK